MRVITISGAMTLAVVAALGCRQASDSERESTRKPVEPAREPQGMEPPEQKPGMGEPGMDKPQGDQPGMEPGAGTQRPPAGDIVTVARKAGDFGTLLSALSTAGLEDTLAGPGPFTVFAPTDEAFAKIPKDKLDALMADKEKLRTVLAYHVVPGRLNAQDITSGKMTTAKTVSGHELPFDTKAGVRVGEASVIAADIQASNGVIHAIDTVLMPEDKGKAKAPGAGSRAY